MEAPTCTLSNFGGRDHDLIDSGFLADCEVVCDGRTWKLHKLILCSRSNYFRDRLLDDLSKLENNKVVIEDFNAQQMGLVISYIYAGNVKFEHMMRKGERLQTSMQLLKLGLYFRIDELFFDVYNFIYDHFIPSILCSARQGELSVDLKDWAASCRLVYGTSPKIVGDRCLKNIFLSLTFDDGDFRKEILQMPEFKALCLEYRDFGSDSMIKLLAINALVVE
ncbi:BTB/POZ protein [Colletotrichum navitas]|uniref:BTB/POZ protein n=1 Tax=Colletotrichum navitas TaxID=681940 RepID=A0AAD8V6E4_9PEZI|nr:BTB/POZ protein [Colletotrichum navitas]KAK1593481.1 BTB/POZ protein [Colletotrichum navitas]